MNMNRDTATTIGGLVLVVAVVVGTFLYGQHQRTDQQKHDKQLQQTQKQANAAPTAAPVVAPKTQSSPVAQQPAVQKQENDGSGQRLQGSSQAGSAKPNAVTTPTQSAAPAPAPKPTPAPTIVAKPTPPPVAAKTVPATGANSSSRTAVVPPAETPKTGGEIFYIFGLMTMMTAGYYARRSRIAVRTALLRS